jgi:hypothetical protein
MSLSQMTHRVNDALKRMTDRLTHRRGAESQQSFIKDNVSGRKK